MFERALGGSPYEHSFPAVSGDRAHDDHISAKFVGYGRQFLVRQAGNKVQFIVVDLVKLR